MKTHFLTLLLAVFLAFGTASFAKAEEAPDVPPEQIETLDAVESGETDETTDPVEAERYFVGGWWTYGGDLGIIAGGDEQRAAEGEEVFFYATPEEGYVCSLIKVSNGYEYRQYDHRHKRYQPGKVDVPEWLFLRREHLNIGFHYQLVIYVIDCLEQLQGFVHKS